MKRPRTAAILLAAGRSQRMGQAKGLLRLGDTNLLQHQVDQLIDAQVHPVIVVCWKPDYVHALSDRDVTLVIIEGPSQSPFDSLQLGLAQVPAGRGCVVVPLDAPLIRATPWSELCRISGQAARLSHQGSPAHPVWISSELQTRLRKMDPLTSRLDHVLRDLPGVREIPVDDPRVLCNLNSPNDLEVFRQLLD